MISILFCLLILLFHNTRNFSNRLAVINNIENGGLQLTDFETSIKSLRLVWTTRALNNNPAPWKAYLEYLLRDFGGLFFPKLQLQYK